MPSIQLVFLLMLAISINSGMKIHTSKELEVVPNISIVQRDESHDLVDSEERVENFCVVRTRKDPICAACQIEISDPTEKCEPNGCGHEFHKDCMTPWVFQRMKDKCPLCRNPISVLKRLPYVLLLLILILSYHSIMGFALTRARLVHAIFWPWYFTFLIWLNKILHRARFHRLCNQYRDFGIPPDVANTKFYKYRKRWYFVWCCFEIVLLATTIWVPMRRPNAYPVELIIRENRWGESLGFVNDVLGEVRSARSDVFGESIRYYNFGEGSEDLDLFYNFAICLQGLHASSFLLFVISKNSKRIQKWALYTEAKIFTVSFRLLLWAHLCYAVFTGWPLLLFILIPWPFIVLVSAYVYNKSK